uniref:Putative secreted protein n=1 Tax=Anopheles darlingi TaxID=43151 RepID=A0A2M4D3K8_ANODA
MLWARHFTAALHLVRTYVPFPGRKISLQVRNVLFKQSNNRFAMANKLWLELSSSGRVRRCLSIVHTLT